MTRNVIMIAIIAAVLVYSTEALAQHAGDVWIGRSMAGQLKLGGFDPAENYITLLPVSGLFNGWTNNNPGFDRIITIEPEHDLYTMQPGAMIWLQLVSVDDAFRVIDSSFSIMDDPGEQTFLGNQMLHTHLTWHINSSDPDYDPNQCVWNATFVLHDAGTTHYTDTVPFTMSFTNVDQTDADGDLDGDGDVDLTDFAAYLDCREGPEIRPTPQVVTTCAVSCLNAFDFDNDNDLDLEDFAGFQSAFGP